ncbi:hypothetical protein M404DRAFT_36754 [Pisolithus tinctorius Marx 270]|uniref:Uncharacterized protein n=1 Tax=Pisolithus tinctorius Marx 270 TaxID=870435 RepID=A0A0C3MUV1_PISTI|nr:hypothetical protein M404DRAFT_36754 [Pisolithus tinctorius Marx 270]
MTRTCTQARADHALESASASRPTQPETSDDLPPQFQGFSAHHSGTTLASND